MKENKDKKPKAFLYRFFRPLFTFVFKIYYNPTIVNKEYIPTEGAAVIAGNHKHALDPILVDVCTRRTVHTLAKKDLHDGPLGWFFRAVGTIPVDLKSSQNPAALMQAMTYLEKGELINVSPEAKRNFTDEILLPFKPGAVLMGIRTGSVIVPYAITGKYKFRSKDLKITFGEPMEVKGVFIKSANEMLYNRVYELLTQGDIVKDEEEGFTHTS